MMSKAAYVLNHQAISENASFRQAYRVDVEVRCSYSMPFQEPHAAEPIMSCSCVLQGACATCKQLELLESSHLIYVEVVAVQQNSSALLPGLPKLQQADD